MDNDLEARIRTRAYQLWENDPSPDSNAEKHWEEARRQIEAEGDDAQDSPELSADQSAERERGGRIAPEDQLQDAPDGDADAATRKTVASALPEGSGRGSQIRLGAAQSDHANYIVGVDRIALLLMRLTRYRELTPEACGLGCPVRRSSFCSFNALRSSEP